MAAGNKYCKEFSRSILLTGGRGIESEKFRYERNARGGAMGRVVGRKGSVGMIKNLPQFNHCQQLFSSSLSSLTNSVPCTPTVTPEKERERVIYCCKANPLETKKRNTQKDGKRCFMIKWEQEQSSLEMESRRVCRKKMGVRVNQWAREGGRKRERGKRCRSRTRLCVRLQLIITDSSSIRHLLRWNRIGRCLTDSCVRRALDFRVTDWCGQLVSQSF